MACPRCGGLTVHETVEDFRLGATGYEFAGWRCINCGAIVDPLIAAHWQAGVSKPALTTV